MKFQQNAMEGTNPNFHNLYQSLTHNMVEKAF